MLLLLLLLLLTYFLTSGSNGYHFGFPVDPSKALGVANTVAFPDSRFSSPSEYNRYYRALYGRLNGVRGWAPVTTDIGTAKACLQIDLGTVNTIYAIATQGNGGGQRQRGRARERVG